MLRPFEAIYKLSHSLIGFFLNYLDECTQHIFGRDDFNAFL